MLYSTKIKLEINNIYNNINLFKMSTDVVQLIYYDLTFK